MYAEGLENEWPLIWTDCLGGMFKQRGNLHQVNFVYTTVAGFATYLLRESLWRVATEGRSLK